MQKKKQTPDLHNFSNNSSISPGTPMKLLFPALLREQKFHINSSKDNRNISRLGSSMSSKNTGLVHFCAFEDYHHMTPSLHQPRFISRASGGFALLVLLGDISKASVL